MTRKTASHRKLLSKLPEALIILAYLLFVTYAPSWGALDSNTVKFMVLSVINIPAILLILLRPDYRRQAGLYGAFFRNGVGLAFTAFLLINLLSVTQAINIPAALIHMARLFPVFVAAYVVAVILLRDLDYLKLIVGLMVAMLLVDSLVAFYYIYRYVQGDFRLLMDITFIYANKNIFASAIFVKMPFAVYMLVFYSGRWQLLGGLVLAAAVLATLFLASRVFFLGLFLFSIAFVIYNLVYFFSTKKTRPLVLAGSYVGLLVVALFVFNFIQGRFYPETRDRRAGGIVEQIRFISREDRSTYDRLRLYRWTHELIRENPLLGVGAGNYKVSILKHENQESDFFNYAYHAHSDFLENTAQTGIAGGLIFLSIFLLMGWSFWRVYRRTEEPDAIYAALFLSAVGLAFYAMDALVNFPGDRPEMQVLFIMFMATGIAAGSRDYLSRRKDQPVRRTYLPFLLALPVLGLSVVSTGILNQAFRSAQLQRVAISEMRAERFGPADRIVGRFPGIPTIGLTGEAIATIEARYLMEEGRYREVIDHLKEAAGSPWDSRRELYLAMSYRRLDQPDSAMTYIRKAHELKPFNINVVRTYSGLLSEARRFDEAFKLLERAETHWRSFSGTPIEHRYRDYFRQLSQIREDVERMEELATLYDRGMSQFYTEDFSRARRTFEAYLETGDENPYVLTTYIYVLYMLDEYEESVEQINHFFLTHGVDLALLNLRGACLELMGDLEGACRDFRAAMQAGFESAAKNYRQFCED